LLPLSIWQQISFLDTAQCLLQAFELMDSSNGFRLPCLPKTKELALMLVEALASMPNEWHPSSFVEHK
jgi:hypothetical protein